LRPWPPSTRDDGAIALAAAPFVTGQYKREREEWLPRLGVCLFELAALAMSDPTGKGDYHGDVDAVRAANTEDPQTKIGDEPASEPDPVSEEGNRPPPDDPTDDPASNPPEELEPYRGG
jgi:hypothetical protein